MLKPPNFTLPWLLLLCLLPDAAFAQEPDAYVKPWTPLILHPVKDAATHELLRAALKEADPVVRERALEALGILRDPADAARVRDLLNSETAATRQQAAKTVAALGLALTPAQRDWVNQGRPLSAQPVPSDALRSTNVSVLVRGLQSLDADGARRESAALLALLRRPEVVVREAATDAIARGRIAAAGPDLLKLLENTDEGLRLAACQASAILFRELPRTELISTMVRRMELDPSSQVRNTAGLVLVALQDERPALDALLKLLQHPRGETRASAAGTVGILWSKPELAPALHPLLADREDLVARAAAGALAILRNPASEAPLLRAFATRGPVVQERVAAALGEIRSTNAVPGMAALLPTTTDEALKVTLVLALGKTGDKRALPPLRKVLELIVLTNNLPKAREAAFVALAAAGDKGAIPRAIQIITTAVVPPAPGGGPTFDDDFVRVAALRYLGAVGDRATGTTLLAAIKHGVTREMRLTVAETLGKLLGQPLRPVPDEDHRRYFVESLAPFPRPVLSPTGTVPGR